MRRDLIDERYRLVRALGRGGFGEVHLAVDEVEGGEVAVKLIERGSSDVAQLHRRLQREARATQVLDPSRVARVLRVGEAAGGQLYVVMPFVLGETVRERMHRAPVDAEEALRILREVALTLDAAHAADLVHRDVKPDNVMLAADGRVVLLDFGIVKALTDASEPDGAAFASTQLTGSGALLGTVAYVAPEQALGNAVDARADQFGLGIMAFELLTGRLPWSGELPARVLAQVLYQAIPRASSFRPELPEAVDMVLIRAVAKQPESRFASAGAFVGALEDAVRHGISPAATTGKHAAISQEGMVPAATGGGGRGSLGLGARALRASWRNRAIALGAVALVGLGAYAVEARMHAPVKWSTAARGTLAVPLATLDARAPCPEWLAGALAEGLTSQLAAGGKVRAVGPRELGPLAHEGGAGANRKGLRTAFGADAVVSAVCARSGAGSEGAKVSVSITSAGDDAHELASFDVSGSASAPTDLVSRVASKLRERLGVEPPDAIERARAERTLPQSPDAARAYVEGLAKMDTFDMVAARQALEQAVSREPQFAPAHAALAKSFAYLGEQTNAARESKLAADNASSLPNEDRLLVEADAAAASYHWDQALETYRAIVKVFPDRTDVALKLVRAYIDAGRPKDARAAIKDLMDRTGGDTGDPRLYLESALAANLAGENANAGEIGRQAEVLAEAVGLTNVKLQAMAVQCQSLSRVSGSSGEDVCTKADRLLGEAGDRMGVLRVRLAYVYLLTQQARFDEAQKIADAMQVTADAVGSPDARATAIGAAARIAKRRGDLTTAKAKAAEATVQADLSGNAYSRANIRLVLAGSLLDSGALEEGKKFYDEALAISRETGADSTTSVILQNLATYWLRKGNITRGRESAEEALVLCDRIGNEMNRPWALDEVGLFLLESDEPEKAAERFAEAMELRAKLKLPIGSSRQNHAESLMAMGKLEEAQKEISDAVEDYRSKGIRVGEEEARAVLARVLLARGEVAKSLEASDLGLALARELKMGEEEYTGARLRATYLAGHHQQALADSLAIHTDQLMYQWDLRVVRGELLLRDGQRERGTRELESLLAEVHAAGHLRLEHMTTALLAGKLDQGYR